jgi:CrcB protein
MIRLLLVCLGGAVGSGARYLVGITVPHGTLVVNLIGSFLIALAMESVRATDARLMIVTGILGGFTTYSAFNEEMLRMMRAGSWGPAAIYMASTIAGCLVAGAAGFAVARMVR